MSKKKPFFAQDSNQHPNHKAAYFWTLEEAKEWLASRGGGSIKKRNSAVVYVFDEPIRIWGEIAHV
ncbi:hypothetical protein SAMD00079811_72460 [Scytonema sp. HK-05]|uniref:hypothetical protein n=1 Tax=Scytonema sp. HK-05 TaxID=1137095 RepID=UPI000936D616|nr:hypothetical protein [Scytonema sp. HK-05]OKH41545.1 hypothetical protein NIES2130_39885 [Scytonema sp. HK-05]BAY49617.1 hypothetical protein SAMD00079811_72460 [Scytonema sp. HK-05]